MTNFAHRSSDYLIYASSIHFSLAHREGTRVLDAVEKLKLDLSTLNEVNVVSSVTKIVNI